MILDISRHKFFEGLMTLILFAVVATVATGVLYFDVAAPATDNLPLLGELVSRCATEHPLLAVLALAPLFVYAVLRLSRATARASIYPQSTLAAISIGAVTLLGIIPAKEYALLMVVALLLSETLGRLLYCFGPNIRGHYLFTAMIAAGVLPLVDAALLPLTIVMALFALLLRGTPREIIIILVGVTLPIFAACYIVWCLGGSFTTPAVELWGDFTTSSLDSLGSYLTMPRLVFLGVQLFLMLSAIILYYGNRVALGNSARNVWFVLQMSLLVVAVALALFGIASPAVVVAMAVVAIPMIPMFFLAMPPFASALAYIIYIVAAVVALF